MLTDVNRRDIFARTRPGLGQELLLTSGSRSGPWQPIYGAKKGSGRLLAATFRHILPGHEAPRGTRAHRHAGRRLGPPPPPAKYAAEQQDYPKDAMTVPKHTRKAVRSTENLAPTPVFPPYSPPVATARRPWSSKAAPPWENIGGRR